MTSEPPKIRAVVFDIGSVLEVIDDAVFPGPFERRHGLRSGALQAVGDWPGDPMTGEMSEEQVRAHLQRGLGLTDEQTDDLWHDYWTWYSGTLDRDLFDWFAAHHGHLKAGILSNSSPGAREAERRHGFEAVCDDIVYSHEVGLAKPDPRIYELTARRLGVEPREVVFLDDAEVNVDAARAAGWHAVHHVDTHTSIRDLEAVIASR